MKTLHFAPSRERRYPLLTAIDLMLHWTLSLIALGLTTVALKMLLATLIAHPSTQLIVSRIGF